MIRIKISNNFPHWPIIRQTPQSNGVWGDCEFFINDATEQCDFWFVQEDLERTQTACCPPQNVVLMTIEPPCSLRYTRPPRYSPNYLNQFSTVITCHRDIQHRDVVLDQGSLPWWVGVEFLGNTLNHSSSTVAATQTYDTLKRPEFVKDRLLSAIASNEVILKGHRDRTQFIHVMRERFGSGVDVFGRGVRDFADKWDVIAPYKYHLAIENSSYPDYWTEKLADAFLGGAYPIYFGCPNVYDYFPEDALTVIDINDPEGAIRTINRVIEEDLFTKNQAALEYARGLVLEKYNLFSTINQRCQGTTPSPKSKVTLRPQEAYNRWRRGPRQWYDLWDSKTHRVKDWARDPRELLITVQNKLRKHVELSSL